MIPKYYEYSNSTKTLAGHMALDNLPYELKKRGAKRPMLITHKSGEAVRGYRALTKALSGTDIIIGCLYLADEGKAQENHLLEVFDAGNCDSIIALGGLSVFELAGRLKALLIRERDEERLLLGNEHVRRGQSIPLIAVPMAYSGVDILGEPELVVLDPRMTMDLPYKEIFLWAVDTLAHGIEAYISPGKNPLSDSFAYSALRLVKENLPRAMQCRRDKKARYGLAQAALLSGLAYMNARIGPVHLLARTLGEACHIPWKEALVILLPHYLENYRVQYDAEYGELLLPLAGPEIYADTPSHERGRKMIQVLRTLPDQYGDKYGGPRCLSACGLARSDIEKVMAALLKSTETLHLSEESIKEDFVNILNAAF